MTELSQLTITEISDKLQTEVTAPHDYIRKRWPVDIIFDLATKDHRYLQVLL
jgi:hypothetical protein